MKFHGFDIEAVKYDGEHDVNGEIRVFFTMSGVNNVATVMQLWEAGKDTLESYKQRDVNVLSLITLISTIYNSFIKKAKK